MSAWETLWKILGEEFADLADFEQTARAALRLLLAAALGAVLGYEREQSGKAAGLRQALMQHRIWQREAATKAIPA